MNFKVNYKQNNFLNTFIYLKQDKSVGKIMFSVNNIKINT